MKALAITRTLETKRAPLALAQTTRAGLFSGYASLFGIADQSGDIVMPGAFATSLRKRGPDRIKMLWQHHADEPIGSWFEIAEDVRGLKVTGRLNLEVARAREILALMREGAVDGLSIGFRTLKATGGNAGSQRRLLAVDLWEISVVTFPMLTDARVASVKTSAIPRAKMRAHWNAAALRVEALVQKNCRLDLRFNPQQARDPAGSSTGGRWTGGVEASSRASRVSGALAQSVAYCKLVKTL